LNLTTQLDPMSFLVTKYACYKKNKVCVMIIDESGYCTTLWPPCLPISK